MQPVVFPEKLPFQPIGKDPSSFPTMKIRVCVKPRGCIYIYIFFLFFSSLRGKQIAFFDRHLVLEVNQNKISDDYLMILFEDFP